MNTEDRLEIIEKAAQYIEEHGVRQDGCYGGIDGGPACFVGAVFAVEDQGGSFGNALGNYGPWFRQDATIQKTLKEHGDPDATLTYWNDHYAGARPKRAVARALRRYAKWVERNA